MKLRNVIPIERDTMKYAPPPFIYVSKKMKRYVGNMNQTVPVPMI